jgi:sensor histidine kinase YesM
MPALPRSAVMARIKSKWAFSLLWTNLAVAIVILIRVAGNPIAGAGELTHMLTYALVYANLTGVLGILVLGGLAERLTLLRFPLVPTLTLGVIGFTALGCLMAQTLLMMIGFVVPRNFWGEYTDTLRIALPLAVVFGLGAFVHASLRGRVQLMEQKLHEKEAAEERATKLALEDRLRSLEARIHPHFLFNTLNSISSLVAVNPVRAEQMVGRLAALLRASLDTNTQALIPLQKELAMVESYVDIERVRFGEKLRATVEVPADLENAKVPPMSVQALVENAVKHGITPQPGGGEVWVTAAADNGRLRIEVRDTGPGFDLTAVPPGHGLDNLVERLDALFGDKASLNVFRRDGHAVVEMVLPRL